MKFRPMHPAEAIAQTMTRLYDAKMTTTSGGNLSIMDENGTLWISPSGVDKAHLHRDDIMCVKADGSICGKHKVSTEYPFHLAIRRSRPELKAVLHAHPAALVAFSLMRLTPDLSIIPGVGALCGKVSVAKYAVPGSRELGDYISDEFAKGYNTVMLENHAIVIGAESLDRAYMIFEAIEYSARIQLNAELLGNGLRRLSEEQLKKADAFHKYADTLAPGYSTVGEVDARNDIIDLTKRCCTHNLFNSGMGVFATRLGDGSFVITPHDDDRMKLEAADLVRVCDGRCETGKQPSAYASIVERIFKAHPDIVSLCVARPPEIMGFAVGDEVFDSRLIPESYICLKNVSRHKFGTVEDKPEAIVDAMSMKNPIAIVENDAVIVAGSSALNAFDRLEVMEFGALSLKMIKQHKGEVVRISDGEIRDLEVAFNL